MAFCDSTCVALNRREFLKRSVRLAALTSAPALGPIITRVWAQSPRPGNPLRLPADWAGDTLTVSPANLSIWPGSTTAVFAVNGSFPGPTIRVQQGQEFTARVVNELSEMLVLHWHGILAPAKMDGHPRDAVAPGQSYEVQFMINQRASTSWYHAHTDLRTAAQVYAGVAGLFIVEDPAEASLGLPANGHDIPLVVADRRSNAQNQFAYAPSMMDIMTGYLGDIALVNGTPDAWLSVDQGLYRFRLLNGCNARVLKIAFSDSQPFHLIGSDSGLLETPVQVNSAMLAPGERMEILVDFSSYSLGSSFILKSLAYPGSGGMMGVWPQGSEMDLMRFYVDREALDPTQMPSTLGTFASYDPAQAQRTRIFTLASAGMMRHTINGRLYDLERVDFTVPWGELEVWEYRNASLQPHPMHMHAALFQVVERVGQEQLPPEDLGWKDTVLVNPGETVRVLVRFDAHPGVFVHHCHNLEHEDTGMMQNFEVLPPPALEIQRGPEGTAVSWPDSYQGWTLQSSPSLAPDSEWQTVTQPPLNTDGKWTVTITEATNRQFYRLIKSR